MARMGWFGGWAAALGLGVAGVATAAVAQEVRPAERPLVEIAILLDTSGSMDGLIDQARARLWSIVNTMALSTRDGLRPDLRVALLEYGNDGLPASEGHIRIVVPLSRDLDKISAELFALTTNGGSEHCGQAIRAAVDRLDWGTGSGYRAIFIAGNEPFTQGPTRYQDACAAAIAKGIVVNTIHCGPERAGRQGEWDQGARLADGSFLNIDQNAETVAIATPFDARLAELSTRMNGTYIPFGAEGRGRAEMQAKQDELAAASAPGASAQRALTKANFYRNSSWDLCDACEEKSVDLAALADEDLPAEMRGMSVEERKAYVERKLAERKAIQDEINRVNAEREAFIAAERKKLAEAGADTFDTAVQKTLAHQMEKKGFKVEIKQ